MKREDYMTKAELIELLRCTPEQFDKWQEEGRFLAPQFYQDDVLLWEVKLITAVFHLWDFISERMQAGAIRFRRLNPLPLPHLEPSLHERPKRVSAALTYFIRAESGGPIKIGKATDVEKRLATLQTSHSQKLYVLAVLEVDREAELHQRFSDLRTKGEWFKAEKPLLDFLHTECGVSVTSF